MNWWLWIIVAVGGVFGFSVLLWFLQKFFVQRAESQTEEGGSGLRSFFTALLGGCKRKPRKPADYFKDCD